MARDVVTRHQRVSVDLQKVVMLPRLPGFKAPCFANRLVDFHHTFAPVSSHTASNEVALRYQWQEVQGHCVSRKEDIGDEQRLSDRDILNG